MTTRTDEEKMAAYKKRIAATQVSHTEDLMEELTIMFPFGIALHVAEAVGALVEKRIIEHITIED